MCDTQSSSTTDQSDATVSVAKVVLPTLVPTAAFATGQCMETNRVKVPLCSLSS